MSRHVLFLCVRSGAKSVIAASLFNRHARELGLDLHAIAAAAEQPYASVPRPVADLLEACAAAIERHVLALARRLAERQ